MGAADDGSQPEISVHLGAARAGARVRHRRQRAAQQGGRGRSPARHHARDVVELHSSAPAQRRNGRRRHGRPDCGAASTEGYDAAVDGDLRRARRHDLVPQPDAAAADGRQPAQGLHLDVRAGADERGTPGDPRHDDEPARLRHRGDGQPESQARRRRSCEGRQLLELGPRGRAAGGEAQGEQRVAGEPVPMRRSARPTISASCSTSSSSCSRWPGRRTAPTS